MFAMLPSPSSQPPPAPSSPRMQGNLWKWTNYISGWQQRWFVLDSGILAYYLAPSEVNQGCRGSLKVASCDIVVHPSDHTRVDIVMPGGRHIYLKASSTVERQQWVVALGTAKQDESGSVEKLLTPTHDQQLAVQSKMAELQLNCHLLVSQVTNIKNAVSTDSPDTKSLSEMTSLLSKTCNSFLKILSECMHLSTSSIKGGGKGGGGGEGEFKKVAMESWSPTLSLPTSSPTRETLTTGKPHFNFNEHPPHTSAPPVTPSHTLPFFLPYPSPHNSLGPRQKKSVSSSQNPTLSLPSHLSEIPTQPVAPDSKKQVTAQAKAVNGLESDHGSDQSHSHSSVPAPLPPQSEDSTDLGHDRQQNGTETQQEQQSIGTSPIPRTHSRANSELFVTPTSTPTGSPPASPSHPHNSLPNLPAPAPKSPILQPPPKPSRVSDRFPRNTTSSDHQSFFSKAPKKFEDLVLTEDDGIPTAAFLDCCRAVVPFFDTLSSTAFGPVKADINGNIEKLSKKYSSSPEQFPTLQSIVLHELETNTHQARNSATDALLWLKRAMEFIQVFIAEVVGGEHSLDIAAGKAYTKSLRRFHNWIVRGIFSMAVRAVPYHKDFITLLGADGSPESEAAITAHMADFAQALGEIISIISQFYHSHKLDTPSPL